MTTNETKPVDMPATQSQEDLLISHLTSIAIIDKDTPFTPADRKAIQDSLTASGAEFNKRNATHTLAKQLLEVKGLAVPASAPVAQDIAQTHDVPDMAAQFAAPQQAPAQQVTPAPVQQAPMQQAQPAAQAPVDQGQQAAVGYEDVKNALIATITAFKDKVAAVFTTVGGAI